MFLTKTKKNNLEVQILGFRFKKNIKNPDFRLTVTAENCCLSV